MADQSIKAQFIRYFMTGIGSTVIDFIVYTALLFFNIHYLIANFFGFMAGFGLAYPLNARWVFAGSKHKSKYLEIFLFLFLSVFALVLSQFVLFVLVDVLGSNKIISKIISTSTVVAWNFVTRKLFLFN